MLLDSLLLIGRLNHPTFLICYLIVDSLMKSLVILREEENNYETLPSKESLLRTTAKKWFTACLSFSAFKSDYFKYTAFKIM